MYTTHANEISDLGATRPPNSVILQPSARIFDGTMIVAGLAVLATTVGLSRAFRRRPLTITVGLLGLGVLGVGVFPGNYATLHPIFALMAFLSGGIAALVSARSQPRPLSVISALLGAISLTSLVLALFGAGTSFLDDLGEGGLERWIAYPVVAWMIAFGGSLLSSDPASTRGAQVTDQG
jgi:hypothetical membrane protein